MTTFDRGVLLLPMSMSRFNFNLVFIVLAIIIIINIIIKYRYIGLCSKCTTTGGTFNEKTTNDQVLLQSISSGMQHTLLIILCV